MHGAQGRATPIQWNQGLIKKWDTEFLHTIIRLLASCVPP